MLPSRPVNSKSWRSMFEEIKMSIEGEGVRTNSRSLIEYSPVLMKSVNTRFSLLAQKSFPRGVPICFAYHAAKILPKFPVGTHTSSTSPALSFPSFTSFP